MRTISLTAFTSLFVVFTAPSVAAQVSENSVSKGWAGTPSYLFAAPTGGMLGQRGLIVGIHGFPDAPTLRLDYGISDRVTLTSGYLFLSERDRQEGEALVGAGLQLGSSEAPVVLQVRANLPINHWLGRRVGNVTVTGARQWGDARNALTAGVGWSGFRGLCSPEWEGCTREWSGSGLGLVGGYLSLGDHVQLVSENYLRFSSLQTSTGIRAGIGGFTAGVAFGCGVYAGIGMGAACEGVQLSATYRVQFNREK